MATYPRYVLIADGCTFHLTWRCHNRAWLLQEPWAKQAYYDLLCRYKDRYHIAIHSYDLMDNHPHLTGTILGTKEELSAFMRTVNGVFARQLNRRLQREGQVVMDRFKSPLIQDDATHLHVMAYGNLNPVRARMVPHIKDYQWTSYHYYANGRPDPLITPAPAYLALGTTDGARQQAYRAMIDELVAAEDAWPASGYTQQAFLGDPHWVHDRYAALQSYRAAKCARVQRQAHKTAYQLAPP
ncbi:MAG: transposase [Deltaproteobacteria bacterium]|nr:transposase [Deltaproteobacteria bacterium]